MQKVVGSSPIIRSSGSPAQAGFSVRSCLRFAGADADSQVVVRKCARGRSPRFFSGRRLTASSGHWAGAVAASIAGLALTWTSPGVWWLAAAIAYLLTVTLLFTYWRRQLAEISNCHTAAV
jgi:hypothetical protein